MEQTRQDDVSTLFWIYFFKNMYFLCNIKPWLHQIFDNVTPGDLHEAIIGRKMLFTMPNGFDVYEHINDFDLKNVTHFIQEEFPTLYSILIQRKVNSFSGLEWLNWQINSVKSEAINHKKMVENAVIAAEVRRENFDRMLDGFPKIITR